MLCLQRRDCFWPVSPLCFIKYQWWCLIRPQALESSITSTGTKTKGMFRFPVRLYKMRSAPGFQTYSPAVQYGCQSRGQITLRQSWHPARYRWRLCCQFSGCRSLKDIFRSVPALPVGEFVFLLYGELEEISWDKAATVSYFPPRMKVCRILEHRQVLVPNFLYKFVWTHLSNDEKSCLWQFLEVKKSRSSLCQRLARLL